ncbi:MAG: TonB-dependent receptor [Bacteroidetes bacterium]|nr:TonB-dependent receptor [Bacteroidota bacterium]
MSRLAKKLRRAGTSDWILIWIVCLLALFPFSLVSAGGIICGKVTGAPGNNSLEGAHIILERQGKVAFTDKDGVYRISGVIQGKVTIKVTFIGFKSGIKTITVRDGQTVQCDFTLEPDAIIAPEIEILDTKPERASQESPVRMEIITSQTISNNPGQNIVSVLDFMSGVNLSSTMGVFSNNTVVSLRGLSGNDQARTLVLLDDVPLNKADAGSVNWNLVNRVNVERIEVIKGPGSAKYGSSAMGGVINIETKQPTKIFSGVATVDYGTFNTAGLRYQMSGKLKPGATSRGFLYGINGFYRRSNGYNPEIPEYLEKSDTFYVNNYLREVSIGAKVGYQFNALNKVEISGNFFNDKRGRGVEIYEVDGAFERHKTWQANARYKGGKGAVRWNILAYNQDENFERLNEYMKESEYNLYLVKSNRIDRGANLSVVIPAGKSHTFTAGMDYQYGSVNGQDIYYTSTDVISNAGKMDTWAGFLQDEIELPGNKLQFNLGIRLNTAIFHDGSFLIENPSYSIQYLVDYQDSLFPRNQWLQIDPKISAQYRFTTQSRIYVSVAQGFRAPNLDDLCRSGKIQTGFKIANPALKPESLDNFEVGADLLIFKKLHLAASVYYSIGKDFMYYVNTGDSVNMGYKRPVLMKQNISRVEITGIEFDLDIEPTAWLSFFANYTFNHSVISSFHPNDPIIGKDLNGKFLTDVPMHKASGGLTIKNKFVNINLLWKYTGERYINDLNETDPYLLTAKYPAFQTFGARLWHTFFKHLTAGINLENIFDTRFIDDRLQQNPGRMITIELTTIF